MSQEITQESQEVQKPNDKEYNFSQIRKQLEQERYARQQAEEEAAQLKRSLENRNTVPDDDDTDEPYVDHKKLNKKFANFEKNMESKIEQKAEQKARMMLDEEKKNSYLRENADFNQVMSSDIVQKFADSHPKLAEAILKMPDGFERQKLVYENIKSLGIDKPTQKQPSIQEKIDQNRRSPYYQPSGVGTSPYESSGDFSPAGQQSAYKKMRDLINNKRF